MSEIVSVDLLLHRIHLFMTEGREEEALAILEKISTSEPRQQREVAYLRAWCAAWQECWDEVAPFLLTAEIAGKDDLQSPGQTERRRRAHYFLLLGKIASDLGYYEEATRHYTQCIKCLDERRMNIPSVRIKARCGLGSASAQAGFYAVALTHYADALHLSGEESPDLPDIYAGLCDVHRRLGNYEQALAYGKKALYGYVERFDKSLEGHMRNLLGRVCCHMHAFHDACAYYSEALELAMNVQNPALILANLTALAEVRLEEGLLDEAQRSYEHALEYCANLADAHLLGMLYIVGGKIAEVAAGKATGQRARELVDEAIALYQKAEAALSPLQAKVELAGVYGRQARLLEVSGRQNEAIAYWKSAYAVYSRPEESLAP
jgi:tetratricopeptide (TPR) repeat protein